MNANKKYSQMDTKLHSLIGMRGTMEEIRAAIQAKSLRDNIKLEPFEEQEMLVAQGFDYGFNVNLGQANGVWFDFEVYLLKTNKESNFIITEINKF